MRSWLFGVFGLLISTLIVSAVIYHQKLPPRPTVVSNSITPTSIGVSLSLGNGPSPTPSTSPEATPSGTPSTAPSTSPSTSPSPSVAPDLTTDANGLSKATVAMATTQGIVKFKFYSNDAPKTVKRFIELIQKGFYNGLLFHRVVAGFVVQGGDPVGDGTGGSGQRLEAEFNNRHHVEGTVAMARAGDPNSADSQFYISLGTFPHLDHNYTIFGQVIEGMDVIKKIKIGDKMTSLVIQ